MNHLNQVHQQLLLHFHLRKVDGNDFPSASEEDTNLVDEVNNTDVDKTDFDGQLLRFLPHTDDRISPTLRGIMEEVAKEWGQTLVITSAYRSAAYNASVGGAKEKSTPTR